MKINFNQPFIGYNGKTAIVNGEPQKVKDLLSQILFSGDFLQGKTENKGKCMLMSYDLSQRIYKTEAEIDITVEEATLIKEAAEHSIASAGGYAQVVNLIEGEQ